MKKQPRREKKGQPSATSNKQKRAKLQAKRLAERKKAEKARLAKLAAAGRYANECELPEGAIAADLSQQVPNNSYGGVPLYYVDQPFTCVDCGAAQVWTATQQKWYYEVAKGSLHGRAIRCRVCRQRVRRQRDEQRQRSSRPKP